jgi:tRNA-dihydrouridine synthase A
VMVGRAAYHDPASVLIGADALWGDDHAPSVFDVAHAMRPYIIDHIAGGGRLHQVTRHMLGLFTGRPGARGWRRMLSEGAARGGIEVYDAACDQMMQAAA